MGSNKVSWLSMVAILSALLFGTISAGPIAFADSDNDDNNGKKRILIGDGTPDESLGNSGDIYINEASIELDLYQKDSSKWNSFGVFENLAAPQLPAGLD